MGDRIPRREFTGDRHDESRGVFLLNKMRAQKKWMGLDLAELEKIVARSYPYHRPAIEELREAVCKVGLLLEELPGVIWPYAR